MKDDRLYLIHMSECLESIMEYTAEGREAFMNSRRTQDAVIRNFEVMGEAAKHLSEPFKLSHEEVPWKQVAGFRDVLIHDYIGVDIEQVWSAVDRNLPEFAKQISKLLEEA